MVAVALMVHRSLAAAEQLSADGISVEVIDPRTISPLDTATILASVAKNGTAPARGRSFRAMQKRIIEVTPDKQIAWEFGAKDAPELNLTWISSIQQLKNGNILAGNFLRGQEGKGAHAFEVTRDRKIVWKWEDHSTIKSLTTVRVVGE